MKKFLVLNLILLTLFSCKKTEHYTIQGSVSNTNNKTIFLEHIGLDQTTVLDSAKLTPEGEFTFDILPPEYPDIYALRIDNKRIVFSTDSVKETIIQADFNKFSTVYSVNNSDSEKIKQLRKSVVSIQNKINALAGSDGDTYEQNVEDIENELENHKVLVRKIILENPGSMAAYFALFQRINEYYIFSPYDEEDLPYWRAVATAFNISMPEYGRSKNLNNIVLSVIKEKEGSKKQVEQQKKLNDLMKDAVGYIDIALPDRNNEERKLSDLKGKVVLINFFAYEMENSIDYTFSLRELYNKHQQAGFEIYQVSLDRNKILWEISTESIPWICVHDLNNENTYYASLYNVQALPTSFLMDKKGNIIARDLPLERLDKGIQKLIKQ